VKHYSEFAISHRRTSTASRGLSLRLRAYFSHYTQSGITSLPQLGRLNYLYHGDILIHFGYRIDLHDDTQKVTITLEQGMDVEILLPSSMELYSILLAVRLFHRAKLSIIIYIDYAKVARLQTKDQLRNWGKKANLPIYEAIVSLLESRFWN